MAKVRHPFPSRTRKLRPSAPMVLHGKLCGRVGRRRKIFKPGTAWRFRVFLFPTCLFALLKGTRLCLVCLLVAPADCLLSLNRSSYPCPIDRSQPDGEGSMATYTFFSGSEALGFDCAARRANSVLAMIAVNILLKSWEMPPASVPMASIF
jgi:hypothetical protein